MQPAETHPQSNAIEQIVKSCKNQGQILAKIKSRFTDIARYTPAGIKIFALYFDEKNFYKKIREICKLSARNFKEKFFRKFKVL